MAQRACAQSEDWKNLRERLHWQVAHALRRHGLSSLLVLRPLASQRLPERQAVEFRPVVERVRELVRSGDVLEADAEQGLGVVLPATGSDGMRVVFHRLVEALCTPIPPTSPNEVAIACAFGCAASSSFSARAMTAEQAGATANGAPVVPPLEVTARAMVHGAWQPYTVLSLTLPVLAPAPRPLKSARMTSRAHANAARIPPCDITGVSASLPRDEDSSECTESGATNAMGTHTAQRGHRRVLTPQPLAVAEVEALRASARAAGVPFARMPAHLPRSCRAAFPATLARELRAVAIGRTRNTLTVAMGHPADAEAIKQLQVVTGLNIFPVLAVPDELDRALRLISGS